MKYTISSLELFNTLQYVSKVITSKGTLPILDYFLFQLKNNKLVITGSDLDTTQISSIDIESVEEEGAVCVPSKLIMDFLKELPDQAITITTDNTTNEITIDWNSGKVNVMGLHWEGYPNVTERIEDKIGEFELTCDELKDGINNTIFAAADKNIRPILNGVCIDIRPEKFVFIATDAHKLVKMTYNKSVGLDEPTMIVIPKKAASLIKAFVAKESGSVKVEIDAKNIYFTFNDTTIICRSIEGKFPNYDIVIPTNNFNKLVADRSTLLNSIKRVSVCANQVTNLVVLTLSENKISLESKDPDFNVEAKDTINCTYNGDAMAIGFKANLLIDILSAIETQEIMIELYDSTKAGLITPVVSPEDSKYDMVTLIMPIMP